MLWKRPPTWCFLRFRSRSVLIAVCLSAAMMAGATTGCWILPFLTEQPAGLEAFASPEAFKAYLAGEVRSRDDGRSGGFEFDTGFLSPAAAPAPTGGNDGSEFSTTNLQEGGVDESDVAKNDGTHLYVLGTSELRIVRAVPAEAMAIVSTVELPRMPESLYVTGDTAVVLSRSYGNRGQVTTVTILDVTDRSAPVLRATVEIDGALTTSRLIGSKLHLVLKVLPILPIRPEDGTILEAAYDDLIPDVTIVHPDGRRITRNIIEWQDFYRPLNADGYAVVAVVTVDLDAPETSIRSTGVLADAGTVYASSQALYIANGSYDYTLLQSRQATEIHKFDFTADGAVPAGSGTIPGRLLNRFSLGEHNGYLRAATTIGRVARAGESDATNNVYVLAEEDGELRIVGSVENIAPGEKIYAARFAGDRGFLVTFKKVDPLFTLNLADPTNPVVVGRLKVPGYSDYIHLLGADHLLTIGKDSVDAGSFAWFQGVQLSLFNVTDFADPQRVDAEIIGERGTESEALRDPHAFNYFEPAQMLAVPMAIAEGAGEEPSSYGNVTFRGLCLYRISTVAGIEPAARISTDAGEEYYYGSRWTRGIFIDDHVYAVTSSMVQALPLADLDAEPLRLALE